MLLAGVTTGADGSWAFLPSTLAAGTYVLSAGVTDVVGNTSTPSAALVVTVVQDGSFSLSFTADSGVGTTGQYDAHNLSQAGSTVVSPVGHRPLHRGAWPGWQCGRIGFKATDHITLTGGFTAADASSAVTSATHGALGTSMTLSDGTKHTCLGSASMRRR